MSAGEQVLRAAHVATMDAPLISDGAVAFVAGRITAVGPAHQVIAAHPGAPVIDLGDALLLPGLVNAHTHLELSSCESGPSPGGDFAEWLLSIRQRQSRAPGQPSQLDPAVAVRIGINQCLRFGVTCVGDITQQAVASRTELRSSPLRCVSFGEVLGLAKLRWRFEELLPPAIDQQLATDRLRIALSPHAPYTVDLDGYRRCLRIAIERSLPLATHLAESDQERPFIQSHSGMFRRLSEQIGIWDDAVTTYRDGGPIEFARDIGLLDYPRSLLAHVNYCDNCELKILASGKASIVYCPRTHAYFGHPPHRWREMLSQGVNVAVGTDSCASAPDLNIVDDLRLLRKLEPQVPAYTLWRMATIRSARALALESEIGSLTPGKRADLVAFRANDNDPLEQVLQTSMLPHQVWIDGIAIS